MLTVAAILTVAGCNVGDGLLADDASGVTRRLADDTAAGPRRLASDTECVVKPEAAVLAEEVARLINAKRESLGSLSTAGSLAMMAEDYACTMIDGDFFGHVNPSTKAGFSDRVAETNVEFDVLGENLAAGLWTASDIVDAWLESEPHREVMLDSDFTHLGIAVRYGGHYGVYCVMVAAGQSGE